VEKATLARRSVRYACCMMKVSPLFSSPYERVGTYVWGRRSMPDEAGSCPSATVDRRTPHLLAPTPFYDVSDFVFSVSKAGRTRMSCVSEREYSTRVRRDRRSGWTKRRLRPTP
jgi:hypothetical protein